MVKRGKFIVFDGLDGSGKTTQAKLLAQYLFDKSKSNSVFLTREPYSATFYDKIRTALKQGSDPRKRARLFLNLFVRDRRLHIRDIEKLLSSGVHVITDRYKYSTLAYQQAQGIPFEELLAAHANMLRPDLVLLIDLPVDEIVKRIGGDTSRAVVEIFEKEEFMQQLRKNYRALPKRLPDEPLKIVSGIGSVQEVFARIRKKADMLFS